METASQVIFVDFWVHVPVGQDQIRPAIVVEVKEHRAPAQVLRMQAQPGGKCGIGEGAVAVIAIQGGRII